MIKRILAAVVLAPLAVYLFGAFVSFDLLWSFDNVMGRYLWATASPLIGFMTYTYPGWRA